MEFFHFPICGIDNQNIFELRLLPIGRRGTLNTLSYLFNNHLFEFGGELNQRYLMHQFAVYSK
jgi:hypothetical protein